MALPTTSDLYDQTLSAMNEFRQMGPANQGDIQRDLMSKVDFLRPQYNELAGLEATAYQAPATLMQQYQNQYGNIGGPDALTRMSSMLGNIGQQYGTVDALGNIIGAQRGRIEDLVGDVTNQYEQQRQALRDYYGMVQPLYSEQAARDFQNEQAKRDRAFQAEQAALARRAAAGGGGGGRSGGGYSRSSGGYGGSSNVGYGAGEIGGGAYDTGGAETGNYGIGRSVYDVAGTGMVNSVLSNLMR